MAPHLNQALFCLVLAATGSLAQAQSYPSKPVRLIAEFGAGSGGDLLLRAVQPGIAESLGQPLIIENRPAPMLLPVWSRTRFR
ncbi:MAG: hypothetical protein ACKVQK_01385 [Burkholderiales bacterium]